MPNACRTTIIFIEVIDERKFHINQFEQNSALAIRKRVSIVQSGLFL